MVSPRTRTATGDYYAYIERLIAERRSAQQDDFISMLLSATVEGQRLSDQDVARFMRVLLDRWARDHGRIDGHALRHLAGPGAVGSTPRRPPT